MGVDFQGFVEGLAGGFFVFLSQVDSGEVDVGLVGVGVDVN